MTYKTFLYDDTTTTVEHPQNNTKVDKTADALFMMEAEDVLSDPAVDKQGLITRNV